jgi:hypothetical protein
MAATSLSHESTIFNRVIDMRENIKTITNRNAGKFERRLLQEENFEDGITDDLPDEQPNVYALNIKGMLGIGDEHMRNAKSAESYEDDDAGGDIDQNEQ